MRRTLSLRKETLTELTPAELAGVAGGGRSDGCPDPPSGPCMASQLPPCLISRLMAECFPEQTANC